MNQSMGTLTSGGLVPLFSSGCDFRDIDGKKLEILLPEGEQVLILALAQMRAAMNASQAVTVVDLLDLERVHSLLSYLNSAERLWASIPALADPAPTACGAIRLYADHGDFTVEVVLEFVGLMVLTTEAHTRLSHDRPAV